MINVCQIPAVNKLHEAKRLLLRLRRLHDIILGITDAWISEVSRNKCSVGQQGQMMVVSVSTLPINNIPHKMASLMRTYSHMASDSDLVYRKTRSAVVFFKTGAIQNDTSSADSNKCWYVYDQLHDITGIHTHGTARNIDHKLRRAP